MGSIDIVSGGDIGIGLAVFAAATAVVTPVMGWAFAAAGIIAVAAEIATGVTDFFG